MAVGAVLALCAVLALLGARRWLSSAQDKGRVASAASEAPRSVASNPTLGTVAVVVPPVGPAPLEAKVKAQAWPAPLVIVASRGVSRADALARGETLPIAKGAHLTLGVAMDGASLVDIDGPAAIRLRDTELELEEGMAEVRAASPVGLRTPHARIHATDASYRVSVDATRTRIERRAGSVSVEELTDVDGAGALRTVTDGTPLVIDAAGNHRNARMERVDTGTAGGKPGRSSTSPLGSAGPSTQADVEARWKSALVRLEAGDRAGAETTFRGLANDPAANERLRNRATFRAAQLALGRGDRGMARIGLAPLLDDPDVSLASDAALLLAATMDTPHERRAVWDRLLARDLPDPYRSDALSRRRAQ